MFIKTLALNLLLLKIVSKTCLNLAVEFRLDETIFDFNSILNCWSSSSPPAPPSTPYSCISSQSIINGGNSPVHSSTSCSDNLTILSPQSLSPISYEASSPISTNGTSTTLSSPKPCYDRSSGIVTSDYGSEGAQSDGMSLCLTEFLPDCIYLYSPVYTRM